MKNNKLLYLLTIFITLFTFNINVNAAQEMTCIYKYSNEQLPENSISGIAIVQYKNGETITRYEYNNDEKWQINSYFEVSSNKTDVLTACPNYVYFGNTEYGTYKYFMNFNDELLDGYDIYKYKKSDTSINDGVADFARIIINPQTKETEDPEKDNFIGLESSIYTSEKYVGICKYKMFLMDERKNHYIQINLSKNEILVTQYDPLAIASDEVKKKIWGGLPNKINYVLQIDVMDQNQLRQFYDIMEENNGNCPKKIYVSRDTYMVQETNEANIESHIFFEGGKGTEYLLFYGEGNNPYRPEIKLLYDDRLNVKINSLGVIEDCKDLLGEDIPRYFAVMWNLVKIGIPILLIALATVDIIQAIFSNKEDGMKKTQEKFIKRVIIAIIIFIVPSIISFLLNIANSIWPNIGTDICGIIF